MQQFEETTFAFTVTKDAKTEQETTVAMEVTVNFDGMSEDTAYKVLYRGCVVPLQAKAREGKIASGDTINVETLFGRAPQVNVAEKIRKALTAMAPELAPIITSKTDAEIIAMAK
jgi:hypothetical protein